MYKLSNKNRLHEGTKPHWTEANLYIYLAESVSCTSASVCHQNLPQLPHPATGHVPRNLRKSGESGETWMRRSFSAEATSSCETSREDRAEM